jgi:hypothetical protein
MKLERPLKQASNALLKGDWIQYQRILRTVPANQETEFLKRLDGILSKIKQRQKSEA